MSRRWVPALSILVIAPIVQSCATRHVDFRHTTVSATQNPFVGTWELDTASLDYQSGRPGRQATYIIEAVPSGLMFSLDGEDADGRSIRFQYGDALDGTAQPLPGGDGTLQLVLRQDDPRSIESLLLRGAQVADRWTREILRWANHNDDSTRSQPRRSRTQKPQPLSPNQALNAWLLAVQRRSRRCSADGDRHGRRKLAACLIPDA